MAIKGNTSVYIYRDGKTREFYAKTVKSLAGEALPEYAEDKRDMLADRLGAAFPELSELVENLRSDMDIPQEYVTTEIAPAIERYNAASATYLTRWLLFDEKRKTFVQINDKSRLSRLSRDETRLENTEYSGGFDYAKMIEHIKAAKEKSVGAYLVFLCPSCGKPEYGELIRGKVACDECGRIVAERDECVKAKFGTIAEAAGKVMQLRRGDGKKETEVLPQKFFYDGKLFGFGAQDAKMLFSLLYRDLAASELFTCAVTDGVTCVDGFTAKFDSYLSGMHRNGVMPELYDGKECFLSVARAEMLGADDAFYKYFCEIGQGDAGLRRVDGEVLRFASPTEYAAALVSAKVGFAPLVHMFDALACEFFLGGEYEPTRAELTRFVYEKTGRFMYFGTDGGEPQSVDFGKTFISDLVKRDGQISARDMFLETVKSNYRLWDEVKGEYDYVRSYEPVRSDYYDRLCFTEYAVGGYRRLRYGRLEIRNDDYGKSAVKRIVVNAYMNGGSAEYNELVELMGLPLIEQLEALDAPSKSGESFIEEIRSRLGKDEVPVELYMYCADARDRRSVKILYGGASDTVLGHAKREIKKNRGEGLRAFLQNRGVRSALECMYGKDAIERNRAEAKSQFGAMCAAIAKLKTTNTQPKRR